MADDHGTNTERRSLCSCGEETEIGSDLCSYCNDAWEEEREADLEREERMAEEDRYLYGI